MVLLRAARVFYVIGLHSERQITLTSLLGLARPVLVISSASQIASLSKSRVSLIKPLCNNVRYTQSVHMTFLVKQTKKSSVPSLSVSN